MGTDKGVGKTKARGRKSPKIRTGSPERKKRLGKKEKQNRRLPVFVTIRTKRKVMHNNRNRNWRTDKIGDLGE